MAAAAPTHRPPALPALVLAALTCAACGAYDEALLESTDRAAQRDGGTDAGLQSSESSQARARDGGPAAPDAASMLPSPPAVQPPPDTDAATPRSYPAPDVLFIPRRDASTADATAPSDSDPGRGDPPPPAADAATDPPQSEDDGDGGPEDDGMACPPSPVDDYCVALPSLPGPPKVDGALDCGVALRPLNTASWNGSAPLPSGHQASLAAAIRPDGLYVYVEVHGQPATPHPDDAAIYCGDAVELYVDADATLNPTGRYDDPGTMQIIVAAPHSGAQPTPHAERFVGGATQGAWTSSDFAVVALADGYAVEAFVVAADLGLESWMPRDRIGLDVAIGVAGPGDSLELRCGRLLGQYFLRVGEHVNNCSGEPWCAATAFCKPELVP